MKNYLLISFLVFVVINCNAQQRTDCTGKRDSSSICREFNPHQEGEPYSWVKEMPKFPGGDTVLLEYIQSHINHAAVSPGIHGRVIVRFVVDENGNVKQANVPKGMGVGEGYDAEVIRVVSCLPKWQAGKQNGHPVPVWYTLLVKF